jgi:hypothetical protein
MVERTENGCFDEIEETSSKDFASARKPTICLAQNALSGACGEVRPRGRGCILVSKPQPQAVERYF